MNREGKLVGGGGEGEEVNKEGEVVGGGEGEGEVDRGK